MRAFRYVAGVGGGVRRGESGEDHAHCQLPLSEALKHALPSSLSELPQVTLSWMLCSVNEEGLPCKYLWIEQPGRYFSKRSPRSHQRCIGKLLAFNSKRRFLLVDGAPLQWTTAQSTHSTRSSITTSALYRTSVTLTAPQNAARSRTATSSYAVSSQRAKKSKTTQMNSFNGSRTT